MGEHESRELAYSAYEVITETKVTVRRNLCFGGAGASLAIVLLLAPSAPSAGPLVSALTCAAIALPLWVMLGSTYEYLLHVGETSYGFLRSPKAQVIHALAELAASLLLLAAVASVIWLSSRLLAVAFVVVSLLCVWLLMRFVDQLAIWVKEKRSQGRGA